MLNISGLTIADIARETNIAESTLRFYRDKFGHFLPSVGEGRKRRYEQKATHIFQQIADLSAKGTPASEIEKILRCQYAQNPIIESAFAETTTKPQSLVTASTAEATAEPQLTNTRSAVTTTEPQQITHFLELVEKIVHPKEKEILYCTVKEAAARTGFSQELIKKCCREYLQSRIGIPCVRTGRGYVIHVGHLEKWFNNIFTR